MKTKFILPLLFSLSLGAAGLAQSKLPRSTPFVPATELSQDTLKIRFKKLQRQLPAKIDMAPDVSFVREQLKQRLTQYGEVDSTTTVYKALPNGSITERIKTYFKPTKDDTSGKEYQVVITSMNTYGGNSSEEFNVSKSDPNTKKLFKGGGPYVYHATTANNPVGPYDKVSNSNPNDYGDCLVTISENGFENPKLVDLCAN